MNDIDEDDDDAGVHEARTVAVLKQLLIDTPASDLPAVLSCLEQLDWQRKTIARAIDRQTSAAGLAALGARLQVFLEEFSRLVRAGVIDLKAAGPATAATICKGLGVLPVLVDAGVLGRQTEKALRATMTQLTHLLAEPGTSAAQAGDRDATDATLTVLTWLSRGLKAGLLASDDKTLRAAFDSALDQMAAWAAAPVPSGLDGHHLAACFVQINTIRQFGILPLEGKGANAGSNRQRLLKIMEGLCTVLPEIFFAANNVDGVQTANVGNTIKDFIDAGLLPQHTHGWLMPVIAILLQRTERVPREEMVSNGGQVLANCANFLRMLSETGLYLQPAFLPCVHRYQASCAHLAGMVGEDSFVLKGAVGQSLANLMSFIKAMAKQEERSRPGGAPLALPARTMHEQLNDASRRLVQLLEKVDFARQSPRTISGLLSALAYVWGRRMAPAGPCGLLAQRLIAAIPAIGGARWEAATVALSLRAIVQLHGLGEKARPGAQPAFLRLLELLSRRPVRDDTERLYCLQALQLALLEQWTTIEQGAMQAALRGLLHWQGPANPGVAQLQEAIASLAHREEAAPPMREAAEIVPAGPPAQPQPRLGTASWSPPGGRLADAGSTAEPRRAGGKNTAAITYRAPAVAPAPLTTASTSTSVSTTANANAPTSRSANTARSGPAGKGAPAMAPDPVTQWFTLASSAERGAGLVDQMTRLASGKNGGMVNRTDEYGNSALYYAVVAGKPEVVQWLLRHPAFTLGLSQAQATDLIDRLEHDILSSISWDDARQALALLAEEVRRAWPEEETEGSPSPSSSSTASRKGKQARSVRKPAPEWETDPEKRNVEWFRLARGKNGGKEARQRMRRLVEIEPSIFSSIDESGSDALLYAAMSGKRQIEHWLFGLYRQGGQQPDMDRRLKNESAAIRGASEGPPKLDQFASQAAASDEEAKAAPPTVAVQIAQATALNDAATVRRLLRTMDGKNWALTSLDGSGNNVLIQAAIAGQILMVEVLLEVNNGQLANQAGPDGHTALLIAASAGRLDVLKVLLRHDRGSAARHRTTGGLNVLLMAAASGMNHCVKYLLAWNAGSLATSLSNDNDTALIIAARKGHKEVVRTMIDHGDVDIIDFHNKKNGNALTVAADSGHAEIVNLLLQARPDLALAANDDMTPLLLAAQAGHAEVIRVMLKSPDAEQLARCVVSDRRLNALDLAEQNGHEETARVLREFNGGSLISKPGQ